jgi:hypothetical protein
VHFVDELFDQPADPTNTAWNVSRPFTTAGTYIYYCEVHGTAGGFGMAGTVVVDPDPPTSSASAPANSATTSFDIPYTASDGTGSGVKEVELWGKGPGDVAPVLEDIDATPESPSFAFTAVLGNGTYEFYTRARDNLGNYEDAPAVADSVTVINDPDLPTSKASSPATVASSMFAVDYVAADIGSGLFSVELWGKAPGDAEFFLEATDDTPDSPSFDYFAFAGDGVYQFYTVAVDNVGNVEDVPAVPDSTTVVTTRPQPVTTPPAPITISAPVSDRTAPTMALASKKAALSRGGTIQVRLSCPGSEPGGCSGKLSLAMLGKRKAKLGSKSFRIGGGKAAGVKVSLTKRNQRLLRKLRNVRVRATITARDAAGNSATRNLTLTVAARR